MIGQYFIARHVIWNGEHHYHAKAAPHPRTRGTVDAWFRFICLLGIFTPAIAFFAIVTYLFITT